MNRMTNKLLCAICALLVLLAGGYAQRQVASAQSGEVGRYRLFAGPSASHATEGTLLYRIDTSTGKTWEYLINLSANEGRWVEVPEQPVQPQSK